MHLFGTLSTRYLALTRFHRASKGTTSTCNHSSESVHSLEVDSVQERFSRNVTPEILYKHGECIVG